MQIAARVKVLKQVDHNNDCSRETLYIGLVRKMNNQSQPSEKDTHGHGHGHGLFILATTYTRQGSEAV